MKWVFGDSDKNMPMISSINKMIERLIEPLEDIKQIETQRITSFGYVSTAIDLARRWKFMDIPTVFV